jgi:hypothetical protein
MGGRRTLSPTRVLAIVCMNSRSEALAELSERSARTAARAARRRRSGHGAVWKRRENELGCKPPAAEDLPKVRWADQPSSTAFVSAAGYVGRVDLLKLRDRT